MKSDIYNVKATFISRSRWLIYLVGMLCAVAGGKIVSSGNLFIIPSVILSIALVVIILDEVELGFAVFPVISIFSLYDVLNTGFSPEKIFTIFIAFVWLSRQTIIADQTSIFPQEIAVPFLIYIGVNILSLYFSTSTFSGLWTLQSLVAKGVLVYLIYKVVSSTKGFRRCLYSLGLLVLLSFSWMFFTMVDYGDLTMFRFPKNTILPQQPFISNTVFRNPNIISFYGITLFPLMFSLGIAEDARARKLLFFSLCAIALVGVFLTFSRAALLAALTGLMYLIWQFRKERTIIVPIIVSLTVIILLLANIPLFTNHFNSAIEGEDISVLRRFGILQAAWDSFLQNPIIGSGPDSFRKQMSERYFMIYEWSQSRRGIPAHNDVINVVVETGFMGLLSFGFLVGAFAKYLLSLAKSTRSVYFQLVLRGLIGSFLAASVHSFFHEVLHFNLLWYLAGLSLLIGKLGTAQKRIRNH